MARRRALRQEKNTCGEGRTGPGPRTHTPPRRHGNRASALPLPYIFKERQEHREQLQRDGDSRLPVHQAQRVPEDSQGRRPDAAVVVLQSLRDLWQQALQSRRLRQTGDLILRPQKETALADPLCGAGRADVRPCAAQPGAWPEALGATQWGTAGQQPPFPPLPLHGTARASCCTHPHPQPSPRRRPSLCPAAPAHLLGSPRQRGEARDCHPAQHRALAPQVELEDVQGGAIDALKVVVVQELKRTRQRSESLARPAELPAGLGQGTRAGHSPGGRQEGPQRALSASPLPSASCPQPSFPPPALREAALATRPTSTKTAMVPMSWYTPRPLSACANREAQQSGASRRSTLAGGKKGVGGSQPGRQTSLGLRCQPQPFPPRPGQARPDGARLPSCLALAACAPPPVRKAIVAGGSFGPRVETPGETRTTEKALT